MKYHPEPHQQRQASSLWKAPPTTSTRVTAEANHFWASRKYPSKGMGYSLADNPDDLVLQGFEVDLARQFYFSSWNKQKAKEIKRLVKKEMTEKYPGTPTMGARSHLSLLVFNAYTGSQPKDYWGDRKHGGMVMRLLEMLQVVKTQLPLLTETQDWLEQHIKDVDNIRTATEALIHKAVKKGLKRIGLDAPSTYGGSRRTTVQENTDR